MHIAIPSAGRPGNTTSLEILPGATMYVPESEEAMYRSAGARVVRGVPAKIRGITATRNWILDNVKDRWVVMVDDDVKLHGWIELGDVTSQHKKITGEEWDGIFRRLFEATEGLKYAIWGVSTDGALRSVYPYRPFMFHSYVTASCMGIVNDGRTRFDESFPVKEDYELCLRCIDRDGGIVAARFCYWVNDHWTKDGGCKSYRTQAMEEEAIKRLIEKYGRYIRQVRRGGSTYSIELDF